MSCCSTKQSEHTNNCHFSHLVHKVTALAAGDAGTFLSAVGSVEFQAVSSGVSLGPRHCPWVGTGRVTHPAVRAPVVKAWPSQRGLAAHVAVPVVVHVRVVVRLHLDLDLGHGAGHPAAHRHGRR